MDLKMTGHGLQKQSHITKTLKNRMNYLIERQGIVSGNIANASTPKYLAQDITFAGQLQKTGVRLNITNKSHIKGGNEVYKQTGKITYDTSNLRDDGNSVKLDQEMLKLNEIQINYRLMTRLYSKQAGMHKLVLQGSRR